MGDYTDAHYPPTNGSKTMKKPRISEKRFEEKLSELLERRWQRVGVITFREAGVLTNNRGLVVTLPNGQAFQLTIVDSTRY